MDHFQGSVFRVLHAGFMKTFIMTDRVICNATNSVSGPRGERFNVKVREQPNIVFFFSAACDKVYLYFIHGPNNHCLCA